MSRKWKFTIDFSWNLASLGFLGLSGIVINSSIAHYAGAEALGIFNEVFSFYIVLSQISVFGIHLSVLKQVSYYPQNHALIAEIVISAFILCIVISSVLAFFTYICRGVAGTLMGSPSVAFGVGAISFGLICFALNKVLLFVLNGLSHMRAYAMFQALRYIFIIVGVYIVINLSLPGDYFALSLTFAELMLLIVLGGYVFSKVVPFKLSAVSSKWCWEHICFGVRALMSGVFQIINMRLDVLCLGYFLTDRLVGIYSLGATVAEGISQISNVARRNVDPLLGEYFSKNDISQIEQTSKKIKRIFVPCILIVCITAVLLYPIGLNMFFEDMGFNQSFGVFVILMVGVVLNALYRPFIGIILQGGRPGMFTLLTWILVLINLIGNLLLIPILGIFGAALATSSIFALEGVVTYIFVKRLFGIKL